MSVIENQLAEDNRRIGAVAAFGIAAFPVYFILPRIIATAFGAQDPTDASLEVQVAEVIAHPNVYGSFGLASIIVGASFMVLSLAMYGHLRAIAPFATRVATAAGTIGGALFLLAGFGPTTTANWLVDTDAQDRAAAIALYVVNQSITDRLTMASVVLFGAFALIASLVGVRAGLVSRALCYLGVALGIGFVLSPILPGELWILPVAVMLVWATWLGIALLRSERRGTMTSGAMSTIRT